MHEPEIALVFSADQWVVALHRHLADHGGARVRQVVLEPGVALDDDYDVLVVGHRWPSLTRSLVEQLHARGRSVVVVTDAAEPHGAAHARDLGVDGSADATSTLDNLVRVVQACARRRTVPAVNIAPIDDVPGTGERGRIVAVGGPGGGGATEVALALASSVARGWGGRAVVVDADIASAAVAQRLGLPIEPNLRDALDAVQHGRGDLLDAVQVPRGTGLEVVAGFPSVFAAMHSRPRDVVDVVEALAECFDWIVVDSSGRVADAEPRTGVASLTGMLAGRADAVVGVAAGTPVGVTRLLGWFADLRAAKDAARHLVVNLAPSDRYRRAEIAAEIQRTVAVTTVSHLPYDRAVARAAWDSRPVVRGPFLAGIDALARAIGDGPRREARPSEARLGATPERRSA